MTLQFRFIFDFLINSFCTVHFLFLRQRVLRDLIADKMPRLNAHLNTCDIDFSLITFNWFHTIFIDNLPVQVARSVITQPHLH